MIRLPDETTLMIPAGALPVTGTVTLHVIPTVDLPSQQHARVIDYGYALIAIDSDGNPIEERFNQDVAITFHYDEQELWEQGVHEATLIPAYFSTTNSRWTLPESYAVDMENDLIVMQIDHFTNFGTMSTPFAEPQQQDVPALSGWGIIVIIGALTAAFGWRLRRRE